MGKIRRIVGVLPEEVQSQVNESNDPQEAVKLVADALDEYKASVDLEGDEE